MQLRHLALSESITLEEYIDLIDSGDYGLGIT